MAIPRDLTPQTLTTSNILLLIFILAKQFEDVDTEMAAVAGDRNIATARADTLSDNWGTLLEVKFSSLFTLEKYRSILQGVAKARRLAPTKSALREMVLAYAPSAEIEILDFYKDSQQFVGPDPATFFTWNSTAPGNRWNSQTAVWAPSQLLKQLGLLDFGSQVNVTSIGDLNDIPFLQFVPDAFEFVRPAHTFVALTFEQEVLLPL